MAEAKEIIARDDPRRPRECEIHCDGAAKMVRLKLVDERDYRLVLLQKEVGSRDELRISNSGRDTSVTMIESTNVGSIISLRGPDTLKVCTRSKMESMSCEFECAYDPATNIVKMTTPALSAQLAVLCY